MAEKKVPDTELSGETSGITSNYTAQKDAALNDYLNREKFSYNVNGDALYQQYKDKYTLGGRMAMMDTMGQAQTMTGGYGNSYAQSVGQQTYQGYMQQLNDVIPELYSLAYGMYTDEGQNLLDRYNIYANLEDQDITRQSNERAYQYGLERDRVADEQWQKTFDQEASTNALTKAQLAASLGDYSLLEALGYDTTTVKAENERAKAIEEAELKAALGDYSGYEALGIDLSNLPVEYDTLSDEQIKALRDEAALAAVKDTYTEDDTHFEQILNDLMRYQTYHNVNPDLIEELAAELIPEAYLNYRNSAQLRSSVVDTAIGALRNATASIFGSAK